MLFRRLKGLKLQNKYKVFISVLLKVVLPIFILRGIGLLQPIELAAYDLLFYLSTDELKDSRIVLVTWTEEDIRASQEDVMSDNTLQFVLETIRQQQPRLIGLDFYRDVPKPSPLLTDEQNIEAYRNLERIYETTENLIGIEKIKPPIIDSIKILKENWQIGSSDLIEDPDNRIRRSFIYPPLKSGEDPDEVKNPTYIGVLLAGDYLLQEGWSHREEEPQGSISFFKEDRFITLKDIRVYDGAYINNTWGVDFLINYRRGDTPFEVVTVGQLKTEEFPADFFRDKIVIFGNVAPSIADRHYIPVRRWGIPETEEDWTYGAYIIAHVTSSIVSAALDGRPLLRVFPGGVGYVLTIITTAAIAYVLNKYRKFPIARIYLITIIFGCVLTFALWVISHLAFVRGLWIPIVPAILAIWGTALFFNNQIAIEKERENTQRIKKLNKKERENLKRIQEVLRQVVHKANNNNQQIRNLVNTIKVSNNSAIELAKNKHREEVDFGYSETEDFEKTELGIALQSIVNSEEQIEREIALFDEYRSHYDNYLRIIRQTTEIIPELTNINQYIQQIVNSFYQKKFHETNNYFLLKEAYDPELESEIVDKNCLEIVLSNLLDNALFAVRDRSLLENGKYIPTISVTTHKSIYYFQIIVGDNGVGIQEHLQKEIFKESVSYRNNGTGVGLFIVKNYLTLEKGRIEVISQVNRGSQFIVSIPTETGKNPAFKINSRP